MFMYFIVDYYAYYTHYILQAVAFSASSLVVLNVHSIGQFHTKTKSLLQNMQISM